MSTVDQAIQSVFNKSRKDKFLLVLTIPKILRDSAVSTQAARSSNNFIENTLQFSVYGSVIPEISVPEVVAGHSGQSFKASSHNRPPFENIRVEFTVDNQFNNYWVVYKWLNLLNNDKQSSYEAENEELITSPRLRPEQYQTTFTIYGKDEFDNNVIQFDYTKAFPVKLGGISYNYRDPSEMQSYFEFAFAQFTAELV